MASLIIKSLDDDFFEAYNEGREDEARFQGMDIGVWSAILDENACDYCLWADSRTFRVGEGVSPPPAHFGCRCVVAYFTEEMLIEDGVDIDSEFLPWGEAPSDTLPPGTRRKD